MSKKNMWGLVAGVAAAVLGAALSRSILNTVEQPKYRVLEKHGDIQLREYAPMIVAEAQVSGERNSALGEGFRIIADYIFGNNSAAQKVAMTAPVTQQEGQKIAMTAPVTQQGDGNTWQVRFVMPAGYTTETLPKPKNSAVVLKEIGSKRFAAIRFSGWTDENRLKRRTEELSEFVSANKLKALSAPTFAFYDPPWTPPFLRRNEVIVEIAG
jgi:hypothetical protein